MPASIEHMSRGVVPNFNGVTAFLPADRPMTAALVPVLTEGAANLNEAEKRYTPEHLGAALERRLAPLLTASNRAIAAATASAQTVAAARVVGLTPPKSTAEQADRLGVEIRARLNAMSDAERHAALNDADPVTQAAALAGDGKLVQMLPETRAMLETQAMVAFHAIRSGMAANRPAKSSLSRIIATGPDEEAVRVDAAAAVARHMEDVAGVEADETALQGLTQLVAGALGIRPEEALTRILASS